MSKRNAAAAMLPLLAALNLSAQTMPELYSDPVSTDRLPATYYRLLLNRPYVVHQVRRNGQSDQWTDSARHFKTYDAEANVTRFEEYIRNATSGAMDTLSFNTHTYAYGPGGRIDTVHSVCRGQRDTMQYLFTLHYDQEGHFTGLLEETAAPNEVAFRFSKSTAVRYDAAGRIISDSVSRGQFPPGYEFYTISNYVYHHDTAVYAYRNDVQLGQTSYVSQDILRLSDGLAGQRIEEVGVLDITEDIAYDINGKPSDYILSWLGTRQQKVSHHFFPDGRLDYYIEYIPDINQPDGWMKDSKLVMVYDASGNADMALVYRWNQAAGQFDTAALQRYLFHAPAVSVTEKGTDRQEFSVYPNPAADRLYFRGLHAKGRKLALWNAAGQKIGDYTLASEYADIAALRPGLYFISLDGKYTARFVKK